MAGIFDTLLRMNQFLNWCKDNPIKTLLAGSFILFSWPFINYPLTDGDIWNWTWVAKSMSETGHLLSGPNDQSHGPLMAWLGALSTLIAPGNFYILALPNILMSILGVYLVYFFSHKFWENTILSTLNGILFSTSIAAVYMSRTPAYDWPATLGYFAFWGFYCLYLNEKKPIHLGLALLGVGLGSLSRFSIVIGLSGIFLILSNIIIRRNILLMIRDGLLVLITGIGFNLPWIIGQTKAHGDTFLNKFLYDNVGRFVKSTRKNAKIRRDYYGFPLYTFIGIFPYTFTLMTSLFQKDFFKRLKGNTLVQFLICGFLPCLLIFSISGHTKLARYISYVFPTLMMFIGYNLYHFELSSDIFKKRCARINTAVLGVIGIVLAVQIFQFTQEAQEGIVFTIGVLFMFAGLIWYSYLYQTKKSAMLLDNPFRLFIPLIVVYVFFFSVLSFEYNRVSFLTHVKSGIKQTLID